MKKKWRKKGREVWIYSGWGKPVEEVSMGSHLEKHERLKDGKDSQVP